MLLIAKETISKKIHNFSSRDQLLGGSHLSVEFLDKIYQSFSIS